MRIRLLGPIDLVVDGQARPVPGLRRRALLAALALRRGTVVDKDQLIELVWPNELPRTAANTLQSHASYLRMLGRDRDLIQFRAPGYVLMAGGDDIDVEVAERMVDEATRCGDVVERARLLRAALELWRGEVLDGVSELPWFAEQADRLRQLRLRAAGSLVRARLAMGEHTEVLPELEQLVRGHPFDEELHGHLILALYRAGRQVEALAAYQRVRTALSDELGIDPSPDLRALETAVLRQDPQLRGLPFAETPVHQTPTENAAPLHGAPAQLPAPTAAFTGRRAELSGLDDLLAGERPAPILTLAGMAGVGKTALALEWAHRVRDRFPDGQLFVDLRGYAHGLPVRPIDALSGFLTALGVPPEQAPVRVDQAAALYRTLVAGRRLLIVLDNARDAEQVRPLLPGDSRCLILITSRDQLAGLVARNDAQPIPVGTLSEDEAHELLARLLGADRVADRPESTMELSWICGRLPLALRIAAATLAWQPGLAMADFVTRLRGDTLRTLSIDGDPEAGVTASFDASYGSLPEPARRLFRLLSLVPGPDITEPLAAALAGLDVVEAAGLLERLNAAYLLDQPTPGRYTWHDLLRAYATGRLADEEPAEIRVAASRRLYVWYLSIVDAAARLLYPHMLRLSPATVASDQPVRFADHAAALRWLDTERPNLVAAVRQAAVADGELRWVACLVADALRGYFHLRRFAGDWLAVAKAALAAATAANDARGMAAARHSLGTAYRCLGDLRVAVEHYTEALRQARSAGWLEAEATALGNLGIVYQGQGRLAAAAGQLTRALDIDRQTGRQDGLANNLSNLATVYLDQDRLDEATDHFAEALELNRRSGTRHGQALALTGLGNAYLRSGQPAAAAAMFAEAMYHCTGIGDRDGQATVHLGLAAVERALGRVAASTEHALAALTLARQGGDPRTEADALIALAATRSDRQTAAAEYARAYDLTTVPRTQIESLIGLAGCARDAGDTEEASRHAHSALDRAHRSGFRRLAAAARELLPAAAHSPPGVPLVRADQTAFTEPEAPVDVDALR